MKLTKYTSYVFLILGILIIVNGIFSISTSNQNIETKKIINHNSVTGGIAIIALGLIMLHLSSNK